MKGLSIANIIIGLLTLMAVALSYFGIISAIRQSPPEFAATQSVTISGTGDTVTHRAGGTPQCDPAVVPKVEASISGGSRDNEITGEAKCSLSSWTATATATDPGTGAADTDSANGNVGRGQGYCEFDYEADAASTTDSSWIVVCTF